MNPSGRTSAGIFSSRATVIIFAIYISRDESLQFLDFTVLSMCTQRSGTLSLVFCASTADVQSRRHVYLPRSLPFASFVHSLPLFLVVDSASASVAICTQSVNGCGGGCGCGCGGGCGGGCGDRALSCLFNSRISDFIVSNSLMTNLHMQKMMFKSRVYDIDN